MTVRLGGNSGSMVGVAISASLLPPAVNAGLYWSMSMISALSHDTERFNSGMNHDNITVDGEVPFPKFDLVSTFSFRSLILNMLRMEIFHWNSSAGA